MRVVLNEINFQNDPAFLEPAFLEKWLGRENLEQQDFKELLRQAEKIAKPKAFFCDLKLEAGGKDFVIISGVKFSSRVLAVNLAKSAGVFPFVATCGAEIEEWADNLSGREKILAKAIAGLALFQAVKGLDREIVKRHGPGYICMMNPGSLPDWPLSEQEPLFSLLGDTGEAIGVELKPDFFMKPTMSASGIKFYADFQYENCLLCNKEPCPGRRAAFDPHAAEKYK
jgi:hypothetical protein